MDFRTFSTRQALATLGACFALLLLASPASAVPDESDAFARYLANHSTHEEESDAFSRYLANHSYKATRTRIPDSVAAALEQAVAAPSTVIPYLGHGVGVTVGDDGLPVSEPTVIPYLSHGIEDAGSPSPALLHNQPDSVRPQLRGVDSAPAVDHGFDWETTGFVGGGILAAMLLALMSTIALRDRRGLRSA